MAVGPESKAAERDPSYRAADHIQVSFVQLNTDVWDGSFLIGEYIIVIISLVSRDVNEILSIPSSRDVERARF